MKTFATVSFLAAALFTHAAAQAASSSLEITLSDDRVVFASATNISLERIFRNVGETNMNSMSLLSDSSVVWDGKEYAPNRFFSYDGIMFFQPKSAWRGRVSISDYLIPATKLTPGKHTISLKYGDVVSNQLTLFIGAQRR